MRLALATTLVALASGVSGLIPPPPSALPTPPPPAVAVEGIPEPCVSKYAWPEDSSPKRTAWLMEQTFGLKLSGDQWTQREYRPVVRIIWQTLDSLTCTDYLTKVRAHSGQKAIKIHAGSTRSWAWGDWSLTHPGKLTFDLSKWATVVNDDPGRLVRLTVHEMGHMYSASRFSDPAFWISYSQQYRERGRFSAYGRNDTETFSEIIGYYVARCAKDNPYDTGKHDGYYAWVKKNVFKGVEFGPAPGTKPDCTVD